MVEGWFRLPGAPLHSHTIRARHQDVRWQVDYLFTLKSPAPHFLRRFAEQDLYVLLAKILKRCNKSKHLKGWTELCGLFIRKWGCRWDLFLSKKNYSGRRPPELIRARHALGKTLPRAADFIFIQICIHAYYLKAELQLGVQDNWDHPHHHHHQVQAVPPLPHRDGPDLSYSPLAWQEAEGRLCWQGLKHTKIQTMAQEYSIGKSENKISFFCILTNECAQ